MIGIPDPMKGHLPFAFVEPAGASSDDMPATASKELFNEVNAQVRAQIGAIASLGGMIQGKGMIPKTRSGKTLRRVLRELVEHAVEGKFDKAVNIAPENVLVRYRRAKILIGMREYDVSVTVFESALANFVGGRRPRSRT